MSTPNHSIILELLKSINAAADLCKTKLPDEINVNFQASSATSKYPHNLQKDDLMDQEPKSLINKTLHNADLCEPVDRNHRKRRVVAPNSSDDESDQSFSIKFTPPPEDERKDLDRKFNVPLKERCKLSLPVVELEGPLAADVTTAFRIKPDIKKKRCMDCNDCHRYSFARQHGPNACLPDGRKPTIRQCAAWQRYDRWRKRGGNTLEYSAWRSAIDLHGPRYAADKDIRDQAMQFVTLSKVEKAKGNFLNK